MTHQRNYRTGRIIVKISLLSAAAGTISHPLNAPPPLTCAEYQQCFDPPSLFSIPLGRLFSRCAGATRYAVAQNRGLHNPRQVRLSLREAVPRQSSHLPYCNKFLLVHDATYQSLGTECRSSTRCQRQCI